MSSVPVEALPGIKCAACAKYLSYFPINIVQDTQTTICGRCSQYHPENQTHIRNNTYESIAQFLKFPCIYDIDGCVESLHPKEIPNHEQNCPYRSVCCPMDCIWQGPIREFNEHIDELHKDLLMQEYDFEINALVAYSTSKFLRYNDELFYFKYSFDVDSKIFTCSLKCHKTLDTVTEYFYEISVYNGTRNLTKKFPMKSANNGETLEINIEDVKRMLDDPSVIIGSIKLLSPEEKESAPPIPKKQNPDVMADMMKELECPVCFHYIIPPIYQCLTGHSICGNCKQNVQTCPTCREDIKNTQNFTLEKMAYLLVYPCQYSVYGCEFEAKPKEIQSHQKFCSFGPQQCPLKEYENCAWEKSSKDVYPHILEKHSDSILDIHDVYVFIDEDYFDQEENLCYMKRFANKLFKLHYMYSQRRFYWSMQFMGPQEEAKNYRYEIDIIDNHANNRKWFLRSVCCSATEQTEAFINPGDYVFLTLDQVQPFITDQLHYLVRITK